MKLMIFLDTQGYAVVEREPPFATRCLEIVREGFTVENAYYPGDRVRRIERIEEDETETD